MKYREIASQALEANLLRSLAMNAPTPDHAAEMIPDLESAIQSGIDPVSILTSKDSPLEASPYESDAEMITKLAKSINITAKGAFLSFGNGELEIFRGHYLYPEEGDTVGRVYFAKIEPHYKNFMNIYMEGFTAIDMKNATPMVVKVAAGKKKKRIGLENELLAFRGRDILITAWYAAYNDMIKRIKSYTLRLLGWY